MPAVFPGSSSYAKDQIRKDFVANVSHELKTPLTVIAGFVENLNFADKLPAQERPLLLMQQQSVRMESTVNDLLILSRIELEQEEIYRTASAPSEAGARLEEKVLYAVRGSDPLQPRVMGVCL